MISFSIRVRRWAALLACAAGLVLGWSARAADAMPAVQLGDSLSDIKAKLGEPRSDLEAGDQIILVYPAGQIVLKHGRATSIELGATPPPVAASAPTQTTAAPPVKTAPGFSPASVTPEYEAAHPPDVRLIERKDAEGVVTIIAESDTNLEFTVTLEVTLNNMTASRPLPVTMDSAGQKSVELVQLNRQDAHQAWSYQTTFQARPGARREAKTNDAVYLLPYAATETHRVGQGNFGKFSHFEGSENEYATDFTCDPGTLVCAARAGLVTGVRQDFTLGGTDEKYKNLANYIIIKHDDGTFAEYYHLQHNSALVHLGERVTAGEAIAKSGATGYVTGPHIHFCVFQNIDGKDRLTLPTKFQTAQGVLPALKEGETYSIASASPLMNSPAVPVPDSAPFLIVAVDGGAASGKSSLARTLAQRFNFPHVDTGSHYRAATLALRRANVGPDDAAAVDAALECLPLDTRVDGRAARITLGGIVPEADALRSPEVNGNVSRFAALPAVRRFLFDYQRRQAAFAHAHGFAGLVMEGRDIGSVIFPDAPLRLFLTADPAMRARRRAAEGQADAVAERDRLDSARATAPLTCPPGAMVIDSSNLNLEEVTARAAELVEVTRAILRANSAAVEFPWFYRLVWQTARAFMQVAGRAEAAGVENVPRTGAFLLASNHASFLDPLLAGCFLPRPVCSFARNDLWNTRGLAWILNHLKCIPVDRDGDGDIGAFKRVFAALKAGEGLQVFPEGTRTRDGRLQPARRGIGLLAGKPGVPVVPVRVFGTFETFNRRQFLPRPFYRLGVTYGRALRPRDYDPGPGDSRRYEIIAQRIMDAIAALPPPWANKLDP